VLEESVTAPSRLLAAVKREVGAADQDFLAVAVAGCARNSDRRADMEIGRTNADRPGKFGDDLLRKASQRLLVAASAPDDRELVAAKPADNAFTANAVLKPVRDFAK